MGSLKQICVILILLISPLNLFAQNSWSYFINNLHYAGLPQYSHGLAIGWNYSGGFGESIISYGTGLGDAPRLKFTSFDGSLVKTELTLKGGKLGIGTEDPTASIHIMGTDDNLNSIRLHTGRFSMGGNAQFSIDAPGILDGRFVILSNGNVGIGKSNPTQKLEVNGSIKTKEVNVTATGWADYVFEPSYFLKPLEEVRYFYQTNGHLENIPSEKEVLENGINLTDVATKYLEKIEELTIYLVQQNDRIKVLEAKLATLSENK